MDDQNLLAKQLVNAMFQYDIVPVLIAIRQDHPFHKRAMELVACDLDNPCETGMCSVRARPLFALPLTLHFIHATEVVSTKCEHL